MARYGLVVDVGRCTGCYACIVACKSENSTRPGVFWIRIREEEEGEFPQVSRRYIPLLCVQCGEMPCAHACPTGAIFKGTGGIILIDPDLCACGGVRPCIAACPFDALSVNEGRRSYFEEELTPYEKEAYEAHGDGTVGKCTLCAHRIAAGLSPACVQACPSRALCFGDLEARDGELAGLLAGGKAVPLREEPKLDPSVFYILQRQG